MAIRIVSGGLKQIIGLANFWLGQTTSRELTRLAAVMSITISANQLTRE